MRSQIKLGRIFGIEVGLHYSWFIIALLIVFSLSAQFHATNTGWGDGLILTISLATAALFFVSLLLHELAHSLVATSNGLPVKEITLFALGGVSQIERNPTSAKLEFWMAFVGPLTSAVIGGICLLIVQVMGAGAANVPGVAMLQWLGYINLMLAVFNLIPGYPLDGGRILRAAIWWKTGNQDGSTRAAARIGEVVAYIFIGLGIFRFFAGAGFGGLWIAFIGWFLLQAARESYLRVGLTHALEGVRVADVMSRDCVTVNGWLNLQTFVEQELLRSPHACFLVAENGEVKGMVTPNEVRAVDRARWPYTTLSDVMAPIEGLRSVTPATTLASALDLMSRAGLNQLPVVFQGHLEGILSRAQVADFLQTRMEFRAQH